MKSCFANATLAFYLLFQSLGGQLGTSGVLLYRSLFREDRQIPDQKNDAKGFKFMPRRVQ